jgi:pseudaminic acid biosynthesis-associated methylase
MANAQVDLWKGAFGDDYIDRNSADPRRISVSIRLWADILKLMIGDPPRSILEVGANVGINLRALRALTDAELFAVEPNDKARNILARDGVVYAGNLRSDIAQQISFPDGVADLAFSSGVLIHIHPNDLLEAMANIYRCAKRYIGCIEYFSDQPQPVQYRGEREALFKRDFGSEWLDNFPDLKVIGYGFAWKRVTGLDNLTWWLFKKEAVS